MNVSYIKADTFVLKADGTAIKNQFKTTHVDHIALLKEPAARNDIHFQTEKGGGTRFFALLSYLKEMKVILRTQCERLNELGTAIFQDDNNFDERQAQTFKRLLIKTIEGWVHASDLEALNDDDFRLLCHLCAYLPQKTTGSPFMFSKGFILFMETFAKTVAAKEARGGGIQPTWWKTYDNMLIADSEEEAEEYRQRNEKEDKTKASFATGRSKWVKGLLDLPMARLAIEAGPNITTNNARNTDSEVNCLKAENEDLKQDLADMRKERDVLKAGMKTVTEERDALKAEMKTVTEEWDALKAEMKTVTEERDALKEYKEGRESEDLHAVVNDGSEEIKLLKEQIDELVRDRDDFKK
ncbi:hypothetical protein HDV00_012382 [Rhizophlyctis rosea]|nr:hypothetical protein HDV00_012382 [Rhizophlyctis rosea]